jgi:apolipoprotein N-acyltransferase
MNCIENLACIYLIIGLIFVLFLTPYVIIWMLQIALQIKISAAIMTVITVIWVTLTIVVINGVYNNLLEIRYIKNIENASVEIIQVNSWAMNRFDSQNFNNQFYPRDGELIEV